MGIQTYLQFFQLELTQKTAYCILICWSALNYEDFLMLLCTNKQTKSLRQIKLCLFSNINYPIYITHKIKSNQILFKFTSDESEKKKKTKKCLLGSLLVVVTFICPIAEHIIRSYLSYIAYKTKNKIHTNPKKITTLQIIYHYNVHLYFCFK
jgi:hypothetical protein